MAPGACIAGVGAGQDVDTCEPALVDEAGAAIAPADATLFCDGLDGAAEAACRGDLTVGLLPGYDREDAYGWIALALPTGLGEARHALIVGAAETVVAIGGDWGALSEIAFALGRGIPALGVRTWERVSDGVSVAGVRVVDDAETAVSETLRCAVHRRGGGMRGDPAGHGHSLAQREDPRTRCNRVGTNPAQSRHAQPLTRRRSAL